MDNSNEQISLDKKVTLYWEEWKYRHDIYWKSFNLWGGAIIFLIIAPYTDFSNITDIGKLVLIFPSIALIMSWVAGWQLTAEIARLKNVSISFRKLLPVHTIKPTTLKEKIAFYSIGKFITRIFFIGFSLLSIIDAYILYRIVLQSGNP